MNQPATIAVDVSVFGNARRRAAGAVNVFTIMLAVLVVIALLAPWIAPYSPVQADLSSQLLPPSAKHLFGTDENGMDVFSRVLWATRTDLTVSILGVLLGVAIGVPLGAAAGFLGGAVDELLTRPAEMAQSLPFFLFALMVFAALGNSRVVLVGVIAFSQAPIFLKLTRSVVLPMRQSDFIAAARCAGLGSLSLVNRHVLPNALGPVSSQLSISCAYAIQIVAGLSFLGLGVPIPQPEWGSMIQVGSAQIIYGHWWPSVFPGLAVLVAVITFGGIGRILARKYGG